MPQLITADFAPQLIWLVITFVLLYLVIWRISLPRIIEVLEERQRRIDDDISTAESLKKEADEALSAYEIALTEARAKAQQTAAHTRDQIKQQISDQVAELDATLLSQGERAAKRIQSARLDADTHIRQIALESTQAMVFKLIGLEVDENTARRAVDTVGK